MAVTRKEGKKNPDIIFSQLVLQQARRSNIDIDNWRNSLRAAESLASPNRVNLYDLYADFILDAHLSSVIDKRRIAILKSPITFSVDGNLDEEITTICRQPWFLSMITDILDSRFWGHTLLEFHFGLKNEVTYDLIPRKHVKPEFGIVTLQQTGNSGIPFREDPFAKFIVEAGEKYDLGLLLKAGPYVIYKRNCLGDYSQYCERFGQPFRKGSYDPYDENTRKLLQQALEEAGSAAYGIFPDGTNIEFIEAKNQSGSSDLYSGMINQMNTEISKLFLGQNLTTESGTKGARSLGDVHMEVEEDIHNADRLFVKMVLNNQFKQMMNQHGFNLDKGEFDFLSSETIDLLDRITIDEKLKQMIPMDDEYFYETYNVPKPDNYDELKKKMEEDKKIRTTNPFQPPQNVVKPAKKKLFNFF